MKKISLNKETLRHLDNDSLGTVYGGKYATTVGRKCGLLTACASNPCCRIEQG